MMQLLRAFVLIPLILSVLLADYNRTEHVIFEVQTLSTPPKIKNQQRAHYPFEMRRQGISGHVIIDFIVDEEGNVQDPLVKFSTNSFFNNSALIAVKKWKYRPGVKNSRLVATRVLERIDFTLNQEP